MVLYYYIFVFEFSIFLSSKHNLLLPRRYRKRTGATDIKYVFYHLGNRIICVSLGFVDEGIFSTQLVAFTSFSGKG